MAETKDNVMDLNRGDMMSARLRQSHAVDEAAYQRDVKKNDAFFRHNYLKFLPEDKSAPILEIGCGLGQFLTFCRTHGYTQARGIDLGAYNVEFCTARGLNVQLGDGFEHLDSLSSELGAVVLNDVVEHIPKELIFPLLERIKKALRPGGVLIMKTINMANPILGAHSRYNDFTHEVGWTEESMYEVLEQAGYDPVNVVPSNLYVFYGNPMNYVAMAVSKCFDLFFLLYFRINGRVTTKVFSKNLIAVAHRPPQPD